MSIINAISKRHKVRDFFMCWYFSFYEQLIISCSVELSMKEKTRCQVQNTTTPVVLELSEQLFNSKDVIMNSTYNFII